MSRDRRYDLGGWVVVLGRALLIGAVSGLLGGALIYFLFGFIGFSGASVPTRIGNGWAAALDPGVRKGIVSGLGIAAGLVVTIVLWVVFSRRFDPIQARPWLAILAGIVVVSSNLESLRDFIGWDDVGILTVFGIALLVGGIVWAVAPWALRGHDEIAARVDELARRTDAT